MNQDNFDLAPLGNLHSIQIESAVVEKYLTQIWTPLSDKSLFRTVMLNTDYVHFLSEVITDHFSSQDITIGLVSVSVSVYGQ